MTSIVSLVRCDAYENPVLENAVRRAVDYLGGMSSLVKPGDRVLLKPNLLSAHSPDRRVTTDPAIVLAVGRLVREAGGKPMIADSPAIDLFRRVALKTGMREAAERLDAELFPLTDPRRIKAPTGSVFQSLEISAQVLEADVVINLPKVKTHGQMLLTLGVKNLFGTIVGQRKTEWHLMIGVDRDAFASLLLDIYYTVRPALTLVDGVWGMEGRGPANGDPRFIGLVAASKDALALDLALCRLLGVPLQKYPLFRTAHSRGLVQADLNSLQFVGDPPADLSVPDFQTPQLEALITAPAFIRGLATRFLISKPIQDANRCVACGNCLKICPADGLRLQGRRLIFDYDRCIRCYCCQEVCPEDAIRFHRGSVMRLMNWLGR